MRVLIVKTSSMGDLVHTLPALTDAWTVYPSIQFDWVCEPSFAEIPSWHPAVADVLKVPLRKWRKKIHKLFYSDDLAKYKNALAKSNYDYVIDAQGLIKSSFLITRFANGIKHGYDSNSARERLSSLAYDVTHRVGRNRHAIERTRSLFAHALGYVELSTPADPSINLGRSIDSFNKIVLITQSSKQSKFWTTEAWCKVIDDACRRFDEIILPVGSDYEYDSVSSMCAGRSVRILNNASLTDVACEIKSARAVVSVDTGLAHVADALKIPTLALYGPTEPGLVGPTGQNSTVIKSITKALSDIPSAEVINWIGQLDKGFDESNRDLF